MGQFGTDGNRSPPETKQIERQKQKGTQKKRLTRVRARDSRVKRQDRATSERQQSIERQQSRALQNISLHYRMLKSRERPRARHFLFSAAAMSDPSKSQPASTAAPAKRARDWGFDVPGMPPVPNFGEESPMPEPKRHKASAKGVSPQLTQELPRTASGDEERNTPTASG